VLAVKKRLFILLVTISKGMRYALIIMMATGVEQVIN
jgi:membrane protein YqaA with SNARE-associated domain